MHRNSHRRGSQKPNGKRQKKDLTKSFDFFRNQAMSLSRCFAIARRRKWWHGLIACFTLLAVVVGYYPPGLTQATGTFVCDRSFYITQAANATAPVQLSRINTATSNLAITNIGTAGGGIGARYNAVGFNVVDGFLYGIDPDAPATQPQGRTVYRIDRNGQATALGIPAGLPATGLFFAGDVDRNGNYFIVNRDTSQLFRLNVTTTPPTVVSAVTLSAAPFPNTEIADVAFNPIDNQLYGFDSTARQVIRINTTTGVVTAIPGTQPPGFLPGDDTVGAVFFDSLGSFYIYYSNSTTTGALAVARNVATAGQITFELLGNPGVVSRFDGTACAYAPVLEKVVAPPSAPAGAIVTYTYRFANSTLSPLGGLTFTDTMDNGRTYVAGTLNATGIGGGTPNNFGGTSALTITNITVPAQTIATISVQVRLPLNLNTSPVRNQASITGVPSNLGGPTLPSDYPPTGGYPDPTPLTVTPAPPTPRIGLAKRVASSVSQGNGVFRVTYELVVSNAGNVNLSNVQVTENLTQTFASAASFAVPASSVSSPSNNLAPNPNYNGRTDTNLLAGTDTLAIGESKRIQFIVDVTPGTNLGPYNNQAQATGRGPDGTQVNDLSTDGTNPDPDGDGNPTNNSNPTPVRFESSPPRLGVAKNLVSVVPAQEGQLTVTYSIVVRNYGTVDLTSLQLTENLSTTFGTTPFTVTSVTSPSGDLSPNRNYNGAADVNLLVGTDTLAVGQVKTLQLVVTITPGNNTRRTYENQVQGTAQSPFGPVSDLSQNGINPDPDNDNNPTNNNDPTPLNVGPNLRLVKRITRATRGGVPVNGINFQSFVDDPNDTNDNAAGWSQLPGGVLSGVFRLGPDTPLQSGDEVEYTVYFLSDGSQPVTNAKVCDPIPDGTTFIPDGYQPGQGILLNQQATETSLTNAQDADKGTFFSRLTPVTSPCPNTNNSNGSVLVQLGDVPSTSPNNVGYTRFRVRID